MYDQPIINYLGQDDTFLCCGLGVGILDIKADPSLKLQLFLPLTEQIGVSGLLVKKQQLYSKTNLKLGLILTHLQEWDLRVG